MIFDLGSLWFFESHGLSNLYGDGIAHVEGARRLFDSLTPGYAEIGSVWLPLFHVLAAPLAVNDTLWRTGLAGSLISAAAFALTAWMLFRFSVEVNAAFSAGLVTLAFFLISPNMLYTAGTPLTEPLAIFWASLTAYALFRFQQSGRTWTVVGAAVAALFGALTRYDGWYLLPFYALFVLLCRRRNWKDHVGQTLLFCLVAGVGPMLWLLHNSYRFHNAFEFYDGPYSAKAIYARQVATTGFHYPTDGSLWLSAHYYLEDLKLVFGPWTLALASLGLVRWILDQRFRARRAAALLLLVPVLFYTQSMAFNGVALYVPTLFPHTYYNLRYGLEMAPALAMFPGFLIPPGAARGRALALAMALCAIALLQAMGMVRHGARGLVTVEESIENTPCRKKAEQEVIRFFRRHYDGQTVLMESGEWPCLNPQIDIPFRKTITPMNRPYWRKLRYGVAARVGWIIRRRGDSVDELMRSYPQAFSNFGLVKKMPFPRSGDVEIYRRDSP